MHALDTLAEQAKKILGKTKQAAGAGAKGLERMLRLLISEPEIRKAAANRARERVWEHYLWGRVAREIESRYLELATEKNLPKPAAPARTTGYRRRAA
jgi:hypothetical protein